MKNYGVSPSPSIQKIEIQNDDGYAVIASDGVWDVVESTDIGEYIKDKYVTNLYIVIVGATIRRIKSSDQCEVAKEFVFCRTF